MKKFSQNSLVDFLIDHFPQFKEKFKATVGEDSANMLFSMWKDKKNKISSNIYKKPSSLTDKELDSLIEEGLVARIGDKIQITSKGSEIIKTMILGDDRSSFEDNGKNVEYKAASEYVKTPSKLKKQSKKRFDQWWERFSQKVEVFDFTRGKARAMNMSSEELDYAIKDLRETIAIQEKSNREGFNVPKLGYYNDELFVYLEEKKRRMPKI
jgi:hypothetical protein